jgi:hypothetical protein
MIATLRHSYACTEAPRPTPRSAPRPHHPSPVGIAAVAEPFRAILKPPAAGSAVFLLMRLSTWSEGLGIAAGYLGIYLRLLC